MQARLAKARMLASLQTQATSRLDDLDMPDYDEKEEELKEEL